MQSLAFNAEPRAQGAFSSAREGNWNEYLKDNLTWTLAHKFGLGSSQLVNEKSLRDIMEKPVADLKQALKARAAVYGSSLDTTWFAQGYDLSAKVKSSSARRQAKTMLITEPLLVAQIGAQKIRKLLTEGNETVLPAVGPARTGTAGQDNL